MGEIQFNFLILPHIASPQSGRDKFKILTTRLTACG
jgi:hypothetical protein